MQNSKNVPHKTRSKVRPGGVKLATLQRIENLLGSIVCAALSLPAFFLKNNKTPDRLKIKKILVIKFFGIGSLILAIPFFKAVRKHFPNAEIHLLTLQANRPLMDMVPDVDHVHYINLGDNVFSAIMAFSKGLLATAYGRYDVLIDMEFYTRASSIVTFFSLAPVRIGYHSRGVYRGHLHSHHVPFNVYRHVIRNFLGLLEPFGLAVPARAPVPKLVIPGAAFAEAERTYPGYKGKKYLIVNINAGELAYERRWFPENFAELTTKLCKDYQLEAIFVGGNSERDYVEDVVREVSKNAITACNFAGTLSLQGLAALCKESTLMLSNDSGPLHVGAAAGAKIVGFFGPETPVLYGPAGSGHLVLYDDISCSPCITAEQGKQLACWHQLPFCQSNITVDLAYRRIVKRFGKDLA